MTPGGLLHGRNQVAWECFLLHPRHRLLGGSNVSSHHHLVYQTLCDHTCQQSVFLHDIRNVMNKKQVLPNRTGPFSCTNKLLKRSSTTTFCCFFFGRRKRGSDFNLAKRGSDMVDDEGRWVDKFMQSQFNVGRIRHVRYILAHHPGPTEWVLINQ